MVSLMDLTLKKVTDDYEILVIDDGSSDHSREILSELEKKYPRLKLIFHEQNKGYGGALRSGFLSSSKELIFYTDGDFQYDVSELTKLLSKMNEDIDVVNGYKISRSDPLHRKIIGRIYHWIMKMMFGLKIKDVDCDFRLIRKKVFEKVNLESNTGVICVEMVKKFQDAGFQFDQVPVHHFFRAYGKSQFFNFKRVFNVGKGIVKLWWKLVVKKQGVGCHD
jgi:glycosyltransferase involved in cell wall biosynthesis